MKKFTMEVKRKGWKMKELALRWQLSTRRLSQIADDPKPRDWDAVAGLPTRGLS